LDGANPEGWIKAQKVSVEQALRTYTVSNAYAGFQEDKLGKLSPEYLADLVVLDRDILEIALDDIKDVKIEMTMVDVCGH